MLLVQKFMYIRHAWTCKEYFWKNTQEASNSACFQDEELGGQGGQKWEGHLLLIL